MKSKTYYGEYSLMHWVNMLLNGEITLPNYQRSFVWKEIDIKRLLKSFTEEQFVQPVTIASCPVEGRKKNLILDGQQRLTTILLAYIGYMPDLSKFARDEMLASGDDSVDENDEPNSKSIKWTFNEIISNNCAENTLEGIRSRLARNDNYKELAIEGLSTSGDRESIIVEYLKKRFLGFSYIVPDTNNLLEIQNGYTRLFRTINYFGKKLTTLGSRRSLYYTKLELKAFFEGTTENEESVLCDIMIKENMDINTVDFVRYLSTLSQYKDDNSTTILKYYSAYSSRESYFADYVSYILNLEQEDHTDKFDRFNFADTFPNNCWKDRYQKLKEIVERLKNNWNLEEKDGKKCFVSWIDADYWLFGLIYFIVFKGKDLCEDISQLNAKIIEQIRKKKDPQGGYPKTPNGLSNLRDRIQDSISIYKDYVH